MEKTDSFIKVGRSFTDELIKKSADQISEEYSYMTLTEHVTFIAEVFNSLDIILKGQGIEVAAGAAVFSSSVARLFPEVNKIYALEIVPEVVSKLQPKIIEKSGMPGRVLPMVGDFNQIPLPDNSLDFALGFDSLHHSYNLKQTLGEISRVLKPGGKLICFDRAHPNHMTVAQEQFLLNTEYSPNYKKQHGLESHASYKRADNGEHEPRIRDWENACSDAKLKLENIAIFTKKTKWDFLKIFAAHVPFLIRKVFNKGLNLTAHNKLLLYYLCPWVGKLGKVKIFPLYTKFKTRTAPMRKMVLVINKL